ncbi:MAG: hypothetical protein OEW24_07190 [Chloroflexota bacterium]|nr:hypothetical protein [Chloroflexota bacterium]
MDERHMVPLETTEGARTAASGSERVLIGLALLALLGAVVIVVSNLVGVDLEASASNSPEPSIRATATPRPARSPSPRRQVVLEPLDLSTPPAEPMYQAYWIRAEEDLAVRTAPSLDAGVGSPILAGTAAFVSGDGGSDDGMGWMTLLAPREQLWVATRDAGRDLVTRYLPEPAPQSASVISVAAGPHGFVASGFTGEIGNSRSVLLASADGAEWVASDTELAGGYGLGSSVAWGPAGWLVAVGSGYWWSGVTSLYRSDDGLDWEPLGRLPTSGMDASSMLRLVGSEFGYLLFGDSSVGQEQWFSADGVAWREMADLPAPRGDWTDVTAIPDGFVAWSHDWLETSAPVVGTAFSIDGRDWNEVVGGPTGLQPHIAAIGDRIVGIDSDPSTTSARVWIGSINRGILTWRRLPGADAAFAGTLVTALTSDGERAYAFGWDLIADRPVTWEGDGIDWTRAVLPASIHGVPSTVVAGPSGVVLLGSRPTMRGDNPIFWHRTQQGVWRPEQSPIFEIAPDRPPDCGSPPVDLLELLTLDQVSAVACLGSSPISFRAWSAPCHGCGADPDPLFHPAWLSNTTANHLILSPLGGSDWAAQDGTLPPGLELQPEWVGAWVEVTGHLDDPAAVTCTYDAPDVPDALNAWWYASSRAWVVNDCRQRFVVESVAVVDGP